MGLVFHAAFLTWQFICRPDTKYCYTLTNWCCIWDLNIHSCFIAVLIFCLTPWNPLFIKWIRIILLLLLQKGEEGPGRLLEHPQTDLHSPHTTGNNPLVSPAIRHSCLTTTTAVVLKQKNVRRKKKLSASLFYSCFLNALHNLHSPNQH